MKRRIALSLLLLMLLPAASGAADLSGLTSGAGAAGLSGLLSSAGALPDPAAILGASAFLYEEEVTDGGIVYVAFTFPMPEAYSAFLREYTALAERAGYTVSAGSALGMEAQKIASGAKAAYLVPDYRGALLFLVNPGLDYAPLPTPTPTPRPTPKPTPWPDSQDTGGSTGGGSAYTPQTGGSSVQYIEVKQDCFACVGGKCGLCNGSGWYRNYGESVPCPVLCQTCDGLGYWYVTQPVWVP